MNIKGSFKLLRKLSITQNTKLNESHDYASLNINNNNLSGSIKAIKLFPGLEVLNINVITKTDFVINDLFKNELALHFLYCLEGEAIHKLNGVETPIKRLHNVILGGTGINDLSVVNFKSESLIKMTVITITRTFTNKLELTKGVRLNDLFNDLISQIEPNDIFSYYGDISLKASKHVNQIINGDQIGLANRLLFEASVFKALAAQFTHFKENSTKEKEYSLALSQSDKSKIMDLSDFIANNLSSNLTISVLEAESGLNQKKIQLGFKLFFNESVNKFITSLRVLKAKELIETTDLSMSEIVYNIGFSSRSYFSKIFSKRYGLLPTEYKKHHHLTHPTYEYCYYSKVSADIEKKDINNIIESSRRNNLVFGISGCLIYHDVYFFQLIEGPKQEVLNLVSKIKKDNRHHNIIKLYDGVKGGRTFKEWQMALLDNNSSFNKKSHIKFLDHNIIKDLINEKSLTSSHIWEKTRNHLLISELDTIAS